MKILFLCLSPLEFTVETPRIAPLGGTESAVAYLSEELVKLGHDVTLMRNAVGKVTPIEGELRGVKHIPISEDVAHLDPDVVVVLSAPQACPGVKKIVPRAKVVLWNHMKPDQPALAHLFNTAVQAHIDDVVYVSDSQRQSFVSAAQRGPDCFLKQSDHGTVINNAISPCFENMFSSAEEILAEKQCVGAYTSTPFRGLAILPHIQELPIDVFSSMQVYQGDDAIYQPMYERLKENDCVELHGSVSQQELANRLRRTAFLVYPSIFAECHSIAILEAMAAGLKVITTDVASPQTEFIDSMSIETSSLENYVLLLRRNINRFRAHSEEWAQKIWAQVQYINQGFTWAKRAQEWDVYLRKLLSDPTSTQP